MSSKQIYFSDKEEKRIKDYSIKWKIAEYEVVRKMVREYSESKGGKK